MEVYADQDAIWQVGLKLDKKKGPPELPNSVTKLTVRQLQEYFKGERKKFDLSMHDDGTSFQKKVWKALSQIPYGEHRSYGEIAATINHPTAYRAVGMANHRNPFMIIVPCHRVIGANKKLIGYAPGIRYQEWLLNFEQSACARSIAGGCE